MKIIVVDPGGNTGVVWGSFDVYGGLSSHEVISKEVKTKKSSFGIDDYDCRNFVDGFRNLSRFITRFLPDVVIFEGFQLWTKDADLTPVYLLTLAEWELTAARSRVVPPWQYEVQAPSERTVIRDEQLKRWGLWMGSKDVRAAMKHLIVYIRKLQSVPSEEELFE